jgi:hypothetical protein
LSPTGCSARRPRVPASVTHGTQRADETWPRSGRRGLVEALEPEPVEPMAQEGVPISCDALLGLFDPQLPGLRIPLVRDSPRGSVRAQHGCGPVPLVLRLRFVFYPTVFPSEPATRSCQRTRAAVLVCRSCPALRRPTIPGGGEARLPGMRESTISCRRLPGW